MSHTGGMISMVKGGLYSTSHKQKLNTKSSTGMELMDTDDVMPQLLWTRYFLEAWGYRIGLSKMYQDNMSTIILDKNGKVSSGKSMGHINIQYLFMKYRLN